MQTNIAEKYKNNAQVDAAESILRRCVHCGFCLATCPTYNLLGDELDSPRGRIYLIKQVLEGEQPTRSTQLHLDRCLTCRNCETTCPSGVEYGHLVDIGRGIVEQQVDRSFKERLLRRLVMWVLPYPRRIGPLVKMGQSLAFLLPASLRRSVPVARVAGAVPAAQHTRRVLLLEGCVQPSMAPSTNGATIRVLDQLGISVEKISNANCCGAIHYHLNDQVAGLDFMRRNIDAWWPAVEAGAEAIIVTASGCGVMVKDYAHALANDPDYHEKASKISALARDPAEVLTELLTAEKLNELKSQGIGERLSGQKVAFHPPCTLQHGQKLPGVTEKLLVQLGFELTAVPDAHVCCGSAGTYSLFQPELSSQLQSNKTDALLSGKPDVIVTANIGCQLQIQSAPNVLAADIVVKHWIELLDEAINEPRHS